MMSGVDEMVEFLLACIAEDKADAQRIGYDRRIAAMGGVPLSVDHPLRLLADCEAKRRLVERASRSVVTVTSDRPSPFGHLSFFQERYYAEDGRDVTDEFAAWHAVDGEPEDPTTLRILAAVFADRPGYREEWKP